MTDEQHSAANLLCLCIMESVDFLEGLVKKTVQELQVKHDEKDLASMDGSEEIPEEFTLKYIMPVARVTLGACYGSFGTIAVLLAKIDHVDPGQVKDIMEELANKLTELTKLNAAGDLIGAIRGTKDMVMWFKTNFVVYLRRVHGPPEGLIDKLEILRKQKAKLEILQEQTEEKEKAETPTKEPEEKPKEEEKKTPGLKWGTIVGKA